MGGNGTALSHLANMGTIHFTNQPAVVANKRSKSLVIVLNTSKPFMFVQVFLNDSNLCFHELVQVLTLAHDYKYNGGEAPFITILIVRVGFEPTLQVGVLYTPILQLECYHYTNGR
jgi:hypothetical protein